jgi:hypothetical protein
MRVAHSRGREVQYEIKAAAKARGAGPRKYAEGDTRRANVNPHGHGSRVKVKMWPSSLAIAHADLNAKAAAAKKPAPFTYAQGTLRLAPQDTRPRSVRRQSYIKPEAVAA